MADNNKMQEQLKALGELVEQGVKDVFVDVRYREYLDVISRFPRYSFNNLMLIAIQNPKGTKFAEYDDWREKYERQVKKRERAISIIKPDYNGKQKRFVVSKVFDVAQTAGKELPEQTFRTKDNYEQFMEFVRKASPVPIEYGALNGEKHCLYDQNGKRLIVREGLDEELLKALFKELAFAALYDADDKGKLPSGRTDHNIKLQADSVAYIMCRHYGLDVAAFDFGNIAGWSHGRDLEELRETLNSIREVSKGWIGAIDKQIRENMQENQVEAPLLYGHDDYFGIYQLKDNEQVHGYHFMNLDFLRNHGMEVNKDNYELIYRGELAGQSLDAILERFNLDHPEDFKGHSLSVSDIVVTRKDDVTKAYYVDSIGFQEISDFYKQQMELEKSNHDQIHRTLFNMDSLEKKLTGSLHERLDRAKEMIAHTKNEPPGQAINNKKEELEA
ncbi:MAG: YodL domain-containing protein [Lachnospiraceae bacterium]